MKLGVSPFIRAKDAAADPRVSHSTGDFYRRKSLKPCRFKWEGQVFIDVAKYLELMTAAGGCHDYREKGDEARDELQGTGGGEIASIANIARGARLEGRNTLERQGEPTNLR